PSKIYVRAPNDASQGYFLLDGLQLEEGDSATPYQPTDTTLVSQYGPELLTNGDFSSGLTNWVYNASYVSTSGGSVIYNAPSSGDFLYQSGIIGFKRGVTYLVTINVSAYTSGNLKIYVAGYDSAF